MKEEKSLILKKTKEEVIEDLQFYFFMYVLLSILLIFSSLGSDYLWSLLFSFLLGFIFYGLIWDLVCLNKLTRENENETRN